MPRPELTDIRLEGYSSAESRLDHLANSWAEPSPVNDVEPAYATRGDEHLFQPAQQSGLQQILTRFALKRRRITGSDALVAVLAVSALTYLLWPTAGEKKERETAAATSAVQSAPVAPVQTAPRVAEPALAAAPVVARPDPPPWVTVEPSSQIAAITPSVPVEASPQIAAAAPAADTTPRHTMPASQNQDIAFVQRPGVNIRSAPSTAGTVVGTPPKGTRFKVMKRNADWVQVESDRFKGWINTQFVGPNEPR
jgi:Bacterial SH3 domain